MDKDFIVQDGNNNRLVTAAAPSGAKYNKIILFKTGIMAGAHSANFYDKSWDFSSGPSFEAHLKYHISTEVHLIMGLTYGRAGYSEIYRGAASENFYTSGVKFGVDFRLYSAKNISLLAGPSVVFESVSTRNFLLSFEPQFKINIPSLDDKFSFVSALAYKRGVGGSYSFDEGYNLSVLTFLIGIEFNPWVLAGAD